MDITKLKVTLLFGFGGCLFHGRKASKMQESKCNGKCMELTQERLKELLVYNSSTGEFYWKTSGKGRNFGKEAGGIEINGAGYRKICVDHQNIRAHRLAWLYMYGEFPKDCIDHINGDFADNRIENLRSATCAVNSKNRKLGVKNKSGVIGVHWREVSKKWIAQISDNYKTYHLGSFDSFDLAVEARKKAEPLYGYHENHGRSM